MCHDRKEIENTDEQQAIHIAPSRGCKDTIQTNWVQAKILFYLFRAFPKFRASYLDFVLFGVKWYIKNQAVFDSFD